jgi:hypothetical protein
MRRAAALLLACLWPALAQADSLLPPVAGVDRGQPARFAYRFDMPAASGTTLALEWTDALGRLVDRRTIAVPADATEAVFTLDTTRAVARSNRLRAVLGGARTAETEARFVVALDPDWRDYPVIMWQKRTPAQWTALRTLGVTAGKVQGRREDDPGGPDMAQLAPLLDADLGFYVENIATDFYSAYHRWSPDHPENYAFQQAHARFRADPHDPAAVTREPSLEDPVWLARVRRRLALTVRAYAPYRPLFYSLADEAGVGDLAAAWDFDVGAASLSAMRAWLAGGYGSLAALNAIWGTSFALWPLVMPETTGATLARADGNHAAWSDFKAWMDVSFARALAEGTLGAHEGDPRARAALEGGQIPGWGGYDYTLLVESVDVLEMYDYARNVDIVRSLRPTLPILTTAFDNAEETATIWRALLRGAHGLVLWDDSDGIVGADGALGARARRLAPVLGAIRGGLGALLIGAEPVRDKVAILYSPESFRAQWLTDRQGETKPWSERDAEAEYGETALRRATEGFAAALSAAGVQARFVSPEQLRHGVLGSMGARLLVLPHVLALDDAAAASVAAFAEAGGVVVADVAPGAFDGHVRARAEPPFAPGKVVWLIAPDDSDALAAALSQAGVQPRFSLTDEAGAPARGVETHVFSAGGALIVAVQGTEATRQRLTVRVPGAAVLHPVFGGDAGGADAITLDVGADAPVLVAALPAAPTPLRVTAPAPTPLGQTATIAVGSEHGPVLRVTVTDPAGAIDTRYGRTLTGDDAVLLPLALNDKGGVWRVRVADVLTGAEAETSVTAVPP